MGSPDFGANKIPIKAVVKKMLDEGKFVKRKWFIPPDNLHVPEILGRDLLVVWVHGKHPPAFIVNHELHLTSSSIQASGTWF